MSTVSSLVECAKPLGACIFLTVCYVGSLYLWKSQYSRDHPFTIKRRFCSAFCMMLISPLYMRMFLTDDTLGRGDVYKQLGLRSEGLSQAIVLPWILTVLLFLGPLSMQFISGAWKLYTEPRYWTVCVTDLLWLRNQIVAPLSEEWVFRACMMPLLLQCLSPLTAAFCGPILFGTAHFHHMLEQLKSGTDFTTAFAISSFQFTYTSLFGAYSAFLFLRTGHIAAPLVAHMFCNHMGFPNFSEMFEYSVGRQILITASIFIGFILWAILLFPLTDPVIYANDLHWPVPD